QTPSATPPGSPSRPDGSQPAGSTSMDATGGTGTGTGTPVVTAPGTLGVNAVMAWQGPASVRAGEPFSLQLAMQSEAPIVSLPLVMTFDPKVVEVVSITEGE